VQTQYSDGQVSSTDCSLTFSNLEHKQFFQNAKKPSIYGRIRGQVQERKHSSRI